MSFRHDKIRGNHPITPKKGIKEGAMDGNNDVISVNDNRHNIVPNVKRKTYHENTMNGKKYFDSLSDEKKINVLATVLGIRPQDVDIGGFEYNMLGKWQKEMVDDMAKKQPYKDEYVKFIKLQNEVNNTRPSISTSRNSKEYKEWANKVNELGEMQKKFFGVRLTSQLNDKGSTCKHCGTSFSNKEQLRKHISGLSYDERERLYNNATTQEEQEMALGGSLQGNENSLDIGRKRK